MATSWTVFFLFRPFTTIHTTILADKDLVDDSELIEIAKAKIQTELGINIDKTAKRLGVNENFGEGWILVEQNDSVATEEELKVLPINRID